MAQGLSVLYDLAGLHRAQAEDGLHQLGALRANQTADAEDFALANGEADILKGFRVGGG